MVKGQDLNGMNLDPKSPSTKYRPIVTHIWLLVSANYLPNAFSLKPCPVPSLSDSVGSWFVCDDVTALGRTRSSVPAEHSCRRILRSTKRFNQKNRSLHHHSGDLRGETDQNHWKTGRARRRKQNQSGSLASQLELGCEWSPASNAETCWCSSLSWQRLNSFWKAKPGFS